jgi:hypothetical protein
MTKRISNHSGILDTDQDYVLKLLKKWQPSSACRTEKDHERHLLAYLQQQLPQVPIVAQYGIAKGIADLVIEDRHVIELKLGFDESKLGEFDRCIGQLERYRQKWVKPERGPVYLVVVGDSDAEFRDMLHSWFDHVNPSFTGVFEPPIFHLVEKQLTMTSST